MILRAVNKEKLWAMEDNFRNIFMYLIVKNISEYTQIVKSGRNFRNYNIEGQPIIHFLLKWFEDTLIASDKF